MKFIVFLFFAMPFFAFAESENLSEQELAMVYEIVNYAKKHSVQNDIEDEKIVSGMLRGARSEFDSHSTYYTEEEYKKLMESLGGSFSGVGVYIEVRDGILTVTWVIKGMPSEKAGIENGDAISHIDGQSTFGLSLEEASSKLRGKKGTKVEVSIVRQSVKEPLNFKVVRDDISVPAVKMKMVDEILFNLPLSIINAQ
jgi:carboxyl-terminal processing protease